MATLSFPEPPERKLPVQIPLVWPIGHNFDLTKKNRTVGCLIGLAVSDALSTGVGIHSNSHLRHPITNMTSVGKWGLQAGQWTDDTSMTLCLASSLIAEKGFNPYDQLVRYKWWYKHGYLSSNGRCFDIGSATQMALDQFIYFQKNLQTQLHLQTESQVDHVPMNILQKVKFNVNLGRIDARGNSALSRIAPIAVFYHRNPRRAVELAGESARLTHGHQTAIDACRYYTALIIGAIHGISKKDLLDEQFLNERRDLFKGAPLHPEIRRVIQGSYKDLRYREGLRHYGDTVQSLEAALWAFWSTDSYEKGALDLLNLDFGTDTVAAVYGQLAGAYYGVNQIPQHWKQQLYAYQLIECIARWLQVLNSSRNMVDGKAHHKAYAKHYIHRKILLHKKI